jgi:Capsule assembly protein Wzi
MRALLILLLIPVLSTQLLGQAETVPVGHPVYRFLKRMEVRSLIQRYHDAVLPLSRQQVATFLTTLRDSSSLSSTEQEVLSDFLHEFGYDIHQTLEGYASLLSSAAPDRYTPGRAERFLYVEADSNVSVFGNALLAVDARGIGGDALGSQNAEYVQFGFAVRGTILKHIGFAGRATNAQAWGSHDLLLRDPALAQSYVLQVEGKKNFDFTEGYVRYDGGIVSAELGREKILWGTGYDQKLVLSGNVRTFDFIRADLEYKSLTYTFIHAWLLGRRSDLSFSPAFDSTTTFVEPVLADKYFAAHRLEFSFPGLLDVGAQEMVVYSNRSVDLAYLNPFLLIESAQRSRDERDNVQWAFDVRLHTFRGIELTGAILFDDINFPELFTDAWRDRFAFQGGLFAADPFSIPNTSVTLEYTRVEPYVYSHDRSREDDYGSRGVLLGPRIGPNADAWFGRIDVTPLRNVSLALAVSMERHGENVVDATGTLIRNVGGDFLIPHRSTDSPTKTFLDGLLVRTTRLQVLGTWEVANQIWLDLSYELEHERNTATGARNTNQTVAVTMRVEG